MKPEPGDMIRSFTCCQTRLLKLPDSLPDLPDGHRVLSPDIYYAGVSTCYQTRHQHAEQNRMRSLLQQPLVGKGAGVTLITVADHIFFHGCCIAG